MDEWVDGQDARTLGRREWIAVVDDDPSIRSSLARLMRAHDLVVETFAAPRDFLDALAAGPPACLVLDVHLGPTSGFQLQENLAVTHPDLPVIFITGHDELSSAELTRRAGQDGFLRKPFDGDLIIDMVRRRAALDDART
ncbi:MAG: response regulator [Gemmatimonadetes bacterium]|nr:MAG: response regulator [Gemmatimonadota bacterium]